MAESSESMTSEIKKIVVAAQKNETSEHIIYNKLANRMHDSENKELLETIANEEFEHYNYWKKYKKASEIKDLENTWWCIYLEEKTEKLMDLADGFEEESITAQMISISNLLIGSFQLIGGYIMADKVEELHNLGILKDLAYQGYLVWANDAIWNGILELAHTIIEFILELITPNDLAADSISAEISAYLETLDWMTDPNFYGDKITLQDAKDLDEFLRYQGLIQGWATDVGIIIGEITENNYVIIGFAVIAHICNVVHGAVFAYSTKQSIAFVLIIIFGFFGL